MNKCILYFSSLLLLLGCSDGNTSKYAVNQPVKVYQVEQAGAYREKSFPAISKPNRVTTLSFRVGGPVRFLNAKSGQYFRKGEVIAMIDNRDFLIEKEKAEAVFASSEAEYKRYKELIRTDNVSQSAYDAIEAKYLADRVNLTAAQNAMNDTKLVAPFDGYIQDVYVEAHQDVKPTLPVVTFIDLEALEIKASVSSDIALHPESIASMEMVFDELPDHRLPVQLIDIAKSPGQTNLSYQLTARMENLKNKQPLIGGLTGILYVKKNGQQLLPKVPVTSVFNEQAKGSYVWLVSGNQVRRQFVTTGRLVNQNCIEIKEGLTGGELVVAAGGNKLFDQQTVKTIL